MAQLILGSNKDSHIDSYVPWEDRNFGSDPDFHAGENLGLQYPKGLISFDVSALAGETVSLAVLRLIANHVSGAIGNTHWAYKLLHDDWVESEVTFQERSSGVTWTSGDFSMSDYTVVNGVSALVPANPADAVDWDITTLVQDAIDSSIKVNLAIIQDVLETGYGSWMSKEWPQAFRRPKLTIDYGVVVGYPHSQAQILD